MSVVCALCAVAAAISAPQDDPTVSKTTHHGTAVPIADPADEIEWRRVFGSTTLSAVRRVPVGAREHDGRVTGPRVHEPVDPRSVKVVHLIQSNHLDIGFSE